MARSWLLWSRAVGGVLALGVLGGLLFIRPAPVTQAIAPNDTATPTATFTPTITPTSTVTLTPTSTATPAISSTLPVATVSPTMITFGSVPQGTSSPSQTVMLTNTGGADLKLITPAEFKDGDIDDFAIGPNSCGPAAPLHPGASCTVVVRFTPAQDAVGNRATTLLFRDNSAAGSPQFVVLNGTATVAPTATTTTTGITFTPAAMSFGSQPVGITSGSQFVVVTNTGAGNLTISAITKSGGDTGDFSAPSTNCLTTVMPGAQCQLSLTFTPTTSGNRATTLIVTSNVPSAGSTQVIVVSGTGTGEAPVPTPTPAPPPPTSAPIPAPTPTLPPAPSAPPTVPPVTTPVPTATATMGTLPGLPNTGTGTGLRDAGTQPGAPALLVLTLLALVAIPAWRRWSRKR